MPETKGMINPLSFAIRPQPQARNAALRGSAELTGLPVSAVGLTTRPAGEPEEAMFVTRLTPPGARFALSHGKRQR